MVRSSERLKKEKKRRSGVPGPFCSEPNNVAAGILGGSFYTLSAAEGYVVVRKS